MTPVKAGETVRLVAILRIEYDAPTDSYFDDFTGATAERMAEIDMDNLLSSPLEELLYLGEVESLHIFPEEDDD